MHALSGCSIDHVRELFAVEDDIIYHVTGIFHAIRHNIETFRPLLPSNLCFNLEAFVSALKGAADDEDGVNITLLQAELVLLKGTLSAKLRTTQAGSFQSNPPTR